MRARAVLIATAMSLAASVPAAGAVEPRRAMLPYEPTDKNHHVGTSVAGAGVWEQDEAYDFPLQKGEKAVSVMVLDDREGPVAAVIVQWVWDYESETASVGHAETWHRFCGQTDGPVPVIPDITVEILLQKGTCDDGSASLPTSGDIVVDFYRKV